MPDYQKAKIYKIVDANEEMVYVGSTVKTLAQRMAHHRSSFKFGPFTSSHTIFDKYGVENCKILLLENYPCNSKEELNKREGQYIKQMDCVNKIVSGRTVKEYYQDNKERIKKYQDANKEHRKEINKIWRDANKEHRKEIKKIYYEKNKEQIREKQNNHYAMKKENSVSL